MRAEIKLKSYSDGELILSEKYKGSYEVKGKFLRVEYENGEKERTKMTLCLLDNGFYKLSSKGERDLEISCSDGVGEAVLTLSGRSLVGRIKGFKARSEAVQGGCKAEIEYTLSFSPDMITKTVLYLDAKDKNEA